MQTWGYSPITDRLVLAVKKELKMTYQKTVERNFQLMQELINNLIIDKEAFKDNLAVRDTFTSMCDGFLKMWKLFNVDIKDQSAVTVCLPPRDCFIINCALNTVVALVEKFRLDIQLQKAEAERAASTSQEDCKIMNIEQ